MTDHNDQTNLAGQVLSRIEAARKARPSTRAPQPTDSSIF